MFFIGVAISVTAFITGTILLGEEYIVLGWVAIFIGILNAALYIRYWRKGDSSEPLFWYRKLFKQMDMDCGCGDCGDPGCGGCS